MTSERLFNSFIPPKKLYAPKNKFLATPLVYGQMLASSKIVDNYDFRQSSRWQLTAIILKTIFANGNEILHSFGEGLFALLRTFSFIYRSSVSACRLSGVVIL